MRMNLEAAYADPTRLRDSVVDRYCDLLLAPGNRGAMIERIRQGVLEYPIPLLRQIKSRTLLLWGKKDWLIPYDNSADYMAALPNATLGEASGLNRGRSSLRDSDVPIHFYGNRA